MYSVDIDISELDLLNDEILKIYSVFKTEKFKEYIAKKCITELKNIMKYKLTGITEQDMPSSKLEEYKRNNRYKIEGDTITIYNDTTLTQDEMYWVSDITKPRYPNGISIAYVLEYGTGLAGMVAEDWEINIPSPSKHSDGTWSFKRDDNLFIKVRGTSPRLIYATLTSNIKQKIEDWLLDYIAKELD